MSRPSDREKTAHLAADLPGIDVRQGDAHQLPALLTEAGIARADAIITSLPWTLLAHRQRDALLDAITTALTPEGMATAVLTRTALPNRARELRPTTCSLGDGGQSNKARRERAGGGSCRPW